MVNGDLIKSEDSSSVFDVIYDVPVRIDWSIRIVVDKIRMILKSAGILSPTETNTIVNNYKYKEVPHMHELR